MHVREVGTCVLYSDLYEYLTHYRTDSPTVCYNVPMSQKTDTASYEERRKDLKEDVTQSPFSIADLARIAGRGRDTQKSYVYQVLRGEKKSRPVVSEIREALTRKYEEVLEKM